MITTGVLILTGMVLAALVIIIITVAAWASTYEKGEGDDG
jgi:sensor domain CHASE-containing protein